MLAADPAHKRGGYPRIDLEMMRKHADGIAVSTGCHLVKYPHVFASGKTKEAYQYAQTLVDIYGKEKCLRRGDEPRYDL